MEKENVWDYPRPPRLEPTSRQLRVAFDGRTIANTTLGLRLLETSHPPTYYLPPDSIVAGVLRPSLERSHCEFKGEAIYFDLVGASGVSAAAAWSYPTPTREYAGLRDYVAFYAHKTEGCWVDKEAVEAQPGDFYGGWITSHLLGPFKGPPGTHGW